MKATSALAGFHAGPQGENWRTRRTTLGSKQKTTYNKLNPQMTTGRNRTQTD